MPSKTPKLWLWEGTEDEESFPIKAARGDKPYVIAYGKKYYLTDAEIIILRQMMGL